MLQALGIRGRVLLLVVLSALPALALAVYVAIEERSAGEALVGGAAVMAVLLVSAWRGVERLVLAPLRVLLDTTRRVQTGDYSARTGFSADGEELSQLGAALDAMAARLQSHEAELQRALSELREQALTDPLTGLYNRRYFSDSLEREIVRAERSASPVSVILMDLDFFKKVNDTWGHDAGDHVLKAIADLIRGSVRESDIAVRHGGEEFAMLLPDTSAEVAVQRAEAMRRELERTEVIYGTHTIRVTASFGVAEHGLHADGAADLMKVVDDAMYAAKAAGRNCVIVSDAQVAGGRTAELSRGEP